VTDVINDEKAVVDLDAAQPQLGVAGDDELVRQLAELTRCFHCDSLAGSCRA
jgi:hypothetical protein